VNLLYQFLTANLLATLMATVIGLLIAYIFDLKKRIRALRYCYMDMSDFCISNIKETLEACSESVNQAYQCTPGGDVSRQRTDQFMFTSITDAQKGWEEHLDSHCAKFKAVGLKPINKADYDFLIE
jgi:hypothetical protein